MKQTDITLNEQYRIDTDNMLEVPYAMRGQIVTGTIVQKGMEYNSGRADGVLVEGIEGVEGQIIISARKVMTSVKAHEATRAAQIEKEKEHKARQAARDKAIADQIDPAVLANAVKSMMYRPADAAVDLVRNLDVLIEYATEVRDAVKAGIVDGDSSWDARPKRDEDGREIIEALPHSFRHMVARVGDVSEAAAKYEAHRNLFNALSYSGVDFEKSLDIEHDR